MATGTSATRRARPARPARPARFEGVAGRVAAAVMAQLNRDMERAAIAELNLAPHDHVLAVGFGPGVGVEELVPRLGSGRIAGIDPSAAMVAQARRRNVGAIEAGMAELVRAGAESIPFADGEFQGVLAVNSMQLWRLEPAVSEVARVLAPGGVLVAVTHVWAIEKAAPLSEWMARVVALLEACSLRLVSHRTESFRSGRGLVLSATKIGLRSDVGLPTFEESARRRGTG